MMLALAAIAMVLGGFVAGTVRDRAAALEKASRQVALLADAVEVHARSLVGAQTVAMDALAHDIADSDWDTVAASPHLRSLLRRMAEGLRHVNNVVLIDQSGAIRAAAWDMADHPIDISDRSYFLSHAEDRSMAVKVGKPIVSRLGRGTIFSISRRLETADGRFAGIILIAMRPQVLDDFYHSFDLGRSGRLTLLAEDGTILARVPHADNVIGVTADVPLPKEPQQPAAVRTSAHDGIARIVAFRRLPDLNLVLTAEIAYDEALAEWRSRLRGDLLLGVPTILVLVAALGGLVAQNRVIAASETAARDSEERFRSITSALPGVVYRFRMTPAGDFAYQFISPQIQDVYGFPPEAVYRDPHIMFRSIVQEDVPRLMASIEASRAALAPWSDHWRLPRGGSVRHLRGQSVPHSEADGSVVWDGVIVDVTELVEARDALTAERQLFVGGPVLVVRWRPAAGWPVDYVSPNVEAAWGYSPADLRAGRPAFAALVHPDDLLRVAHEVEQLCDAGRPYFEQEFRIFRADGEVRWVYDFTIVVRDGRGGVDHLQGYILDITERKEMERQIEGERDFFRTVINSLPGVFYVIAPDGRFELFNDSLARIAGAPAEEIKQDGPLALLRPQDRQAVAQAMRQVFETGASEVEACLLTRDGRELPYYFNGVRFESTAGPRLVGMGLDVSARKRMEEDIRKSNEELESFAYIASHDLQEPLRTVSTFLQLLKREHGASLPPEGIEYVDFAVDGAMRMSHLIRDLLQYSRAGRGRVAMDARCDLNAAVEEAVALLGTSLADSGAEVHAEPLPLVRGDADQIIRLLQNLIGNAVKYRDKDRRPEISITADQAGGWVTVSVADNGIGIDPDYHAKIFQVFQRLHGRSEYEGTGIGLAICKKIVAAHGGSIWVDSEAGAGATFRFTLPAADHPAPT